MSQVATPTEARQAAEEAAHGWHAKLKVEHSKLDEDDRSRLCKLIELEHRWPNPMSQQEAGTEQGSVCRLPIKCMYHATGYEACRKQERGWVNEIKANRKANPYAPFNAGLVAVDGVKTRAEFSLKKALKGDYKCKVFGHQHCFQATDELNEEIPTEPAFERFESKIYIGLTPDMIRFLGEMQNTIDQQTKGRSNIDLMKGLRSTMSEKDGVLYTVYREALISEFEAPEEVEVDALGRWREDGLVAKMAEFESDHGFTHPDVTKYPKGFVFIQETAGEGEEEAEEQIARVLDLEAIDTHLELYFGRNRNSLFSGISP